MMGSRRLQVVVDCDPGIDDAVALALIAASEELELRAVTTISGNVPVELSTRNAARVLQLLGREEVPIAAGASRPLIRATPAYPPIHGVNGLGEVELPAAPNEDGAEPAIDLLAGVLRDAEPGTVTVLALGPLTNIALLLAVHPELSSRIARLLTMSASIDRGNVTPYAEFNVWVDPEAAHRILVESDLSLRVVTLAATRRAALDEEQRLALAACSLPGELLAEMILGYTDLDPDSGWPLHDAMVVASLLDPEIVEVREASVTVDTGTGPQRGRTEFDFSAHGPLKLEVGVDADAARFRELLSARISRY